MGLSVLPLSVEPSALFSRFAGLGVCGLATYGREERDYSQRQNGRVKVAETESLAMFESWLVRRCGLDATFSQASASKLFLRVTERTCQCFQAAGAQAYGGSSKPHRHAHYRMGHPAVIALFAFA
jgi:hypothetical protein